MPGIKNSNSDLKEKIRNTIYGAAAGDALGVPVEFKARETIKYNPVTGMRGFGTYNLPEGTWSDDTSMTLCLADSIGITGGIDYKDIMRRFQDWFFNSKYTSDNHTFDVGNACRTAICNYSKGTAPLACGMKEENCNGNGSLMRISPLPFYLLKLYGPEAMEQEAAFELVHNISSLTHAHPISLTGCDIYCAAMLELIKGTAKEEAVQAAGNKMQAYIKKHPEYAAAYSKYSRIFKAGFKDTPEYYIESSGYVVHTLEAALWCFLNTGNYKDCVLKAVNLGYDTDSVASVAGSMAGLHYGNIPADWLHRLRNRKLIDKAINSFTKTICR